MNNYIQQKYIAQKIMGNKYLTVSKLQISYTNKSNMSVSSYLVLLWIIPV